MLEALISPAVSGTTDLSLRRLLVSHDQFTTRQGGAGQILDSCELARVEKEREEHARVEVIVCCAVLCWR